MQALRYKQQTNMASMPYLMIAHAANVRGSFFSHTKYKSQVDMFTARHAYEKVMEQCSQALASSAPLLMCFELLTSQWV